LIISIIKGYARKALAFDLVHMFSALVSWKEDISWYRPVPEIAIILSFEPRHVKTNIMRLRPALIQTSLRRINAVRLQTL
jgi:hypothetical protein